MRSRLNTAWEAVCRIVEAGFALGIRIVWGTCIVWSLVLVGLQTNGWIRYGEWIPLPAGFFLVRPELDWLSSGVSDPTRTKRRQQAAASIAPYVPSLPRSAATNKLGWWLYEPDSWIGLQRIVLWLLKLPMTLVLFLGGVFIMLARPAPTLAQPTTRNVVR